MADGNDFQKLVLEAVTACGADIAEIERYVKDRMTKMEPNDRARLERDIQTVIGFREPTAPPYKLS